MGLNMMDVAKLMKDGNPVQVVYNYAAAIERVIINAPLTPDGDKQIADRMRELLPVFQDAMKKMEAFGAIPHINPKIDNTKGRMDV